MTRIIEFLIALGIVAGLFVIIGVCLPGERHITESIETNRKMTIVYDTVSSLRRFATGTRWYCAIPPLN